MKKTLVFKIVSFNKASKFCLSYFLIKQWFVILNSNNDQIIFFNSII